ncbi:MAG: TraR/DksA C4-type zinc finger protein [Bacteroidales bacterium]|nr:TraR/DksA C4-type zinc finger protein [Bacteroidales bacterium]
MQKPTPEQIKEFIQKEIAKTEKLVKEYKELTKPIAPENAIGRVSRMDAINNKSVTEAALRQAEEKLRKLKEVIKTINNKDFGICVSCHRPIPIQRIMLMPQSRKCVNCA